MIFNKDWSSTKSKLYIIPDTCNYMKINDNSDRGNELGTKLTFNKRTGELFSKTDKIYLKKVNRLASKSTNREHRKLLRKLVRNW
jgi:hypothetical protein